MTPDVDGLSRFYRTPLGRLARRLIREQVSALAGDVTGRRILGLGYTTPYLGATLGGAERVLVFMPARQGAAPWPPEAPNHTVLCDPLEMPLTDAAVDLVLIVHGLEHVVDAEELMRELWRVCAPGADLVIAVPRRRGLWAGMDNTPFGQGRPYSRSQLEKLLRDHSFTPRAWRECLYVPPFNRGAIVRSARVFERTGRMLGATFAGVMCVHARKEQVPAVTRRKRASASAPSTVFAGQTARSRP
ncbi:methyltransferase domain-containing protein [Pelagibacterium montanilacus]|uniref:methyltransferase domain-containing protein n=1 Tax=Pelagibacterium montanilacus TaxID=2185280 RepID=UPI000F8F6641|nr:methyltransferase domain-containing protein [Pelagibacterium montanilacus]